VTDHPLEPPPPARRGLATILAVGAALGAVVLLAVALAGSLGSEEIVVEVPLGTAERMAAGEEVELLPRTLRVAVGDRLRIVNHDDAPHEVGPYAVAPGQTLEQTFTSPGTLEGLCTLHPSGAITIEVR
jgi:plastocyanin